MDPRIDPLLVIVLLVNFFSLGASRLRTVISAVALQGVVLGVLVVLVHGEIAIRPALLAAGAIVLKGLVIPAMLEKAMRDAAIKREVEPYVGFIPSLLLGALGTGLSLLFARTLPLAPEHAGSMMVPASLATVLTGFLVLTTRRKAINQVVGYLILENGIFIFGLLLVEAMPFLVEVGVLLDLFVGIFVMGIIVNHISRTFSSMDADNLTALKD
ncbi:MAG: hydrogenase-4 component [Planctomycetota bacterium]|nr:MAG: hydrogenase-4 component [Planctomycetota bacterium]